MIDSGDLRTEELAPITRADIARYAGASGDFNPIHVDEEFAKSAGFPSVFAMGMLTSGHLSRMVTDWFGVSSTLRFSTRFTGRVWPGDRLTLGARVTAVQAADAGENRAELELWVDNQEGQRVIAGAATVALAGER